MSSRAAAAVIAGIVAIVGFVLLLLPVSITDTTDPMNASVPCGTALHQSGDGLGMDLGAGLAGVTTNYVQQCSAALSTRRLIAWPILGVGSLAVVFIFLTAIQPAPKPKPKSDTEAPATL